MFKSIKLLFVLFMGNSPSKFQSELDQAIISDGQDFLKIYTFPYADRNKQQAKKKLPAFYIIDNVHARLSQIILELSQTIQNLREQFKEPIFTFEKTQLPNTMTIKQLKVKFKKRKCNGTQLYLTQFKKGDEGDHRRQLKLKVEEDLRDQAVIVDLCDPQKLDNQIRQYTQFRINFQLPNEEYTLTQAFEVFDTFEMMINRFEDIIAKQFQAKLDINGYKIKDPDDGYEQILEDSYLDSIYDKQLQSIPQIKNYITIKVKLNQKLDLQRKHINPCKKIIIYKQNSIEYVQEQFDTIELWNFKKIYDLLLRPNGGVIDPSKRCLMMCEEVLVTQTQNLSAFSKYFANDGPFKESGFVLVTRVITEKMYFYKVIQQLASRPLNMENLFQNCTYRQPDYNGQPIEKLYQLARNRALSQNRQYFKKLQNILQSSKRQYFRKLQNLLPIYAYTSQQAYRDNQIQDKKEPIYISLNRDLRNSNILQQYSHKTKLKWAYQFASKILLDLIQVPTTRPNSNKQRLVTFRGVKADLKLKKNSYLTFKSFISTSTSRRTAENFIRRNQNKISTLLVLELLQGKDISEFSVYEESQILLEPFSNFQVVEVKKKAQQIGKCMVDIVFLRQLPKAPSNYVKFIDQFIIWVDDDKQEFGYNVFKTIQKFNHTTVLLQMRSTKELTDWLKLQKIQNFLKDEGARCVFISNMTRLDVDEKGCNLNPKAGIQGLMQFQNYKTYTNVPIMFYVKDQEQEEARKVLQDSKSLLRNFKQIKVTASTFQLALFLQKMLQIQFYDIKSFEKPQQPKNTLAQTTKEVSKQEKIQLEQPLTGPIIIRANKSQQTQTKQCQTI